MKTGILTYHRAENYGALLQAYALKTYLESQGHDVSFVDYWPDYHRRYYQILSLKRAFSRSFRGNIEYLRRTLPYYGSKKRRKRILCSFMKQCLNLSETASYSKPSDRCEEFDVVVYGSDQIWRKQGMNDFPGFDPWYFGSDNILARKVTYAASMGKVDLSDAEKEAFFGYMKNFDSISARERSLQNFLALRDVKSELVLDPVFLLDSESWKRLVAPRCRKEKYILFYNLLGSKEAVAFVNNLSRQTSLPVVEITKIWDKKHSSSRYDHESSVQQFLSLVADAEYVVSNSFHGVAFSIIFEKQFYAVGMGNRADRVISLLETSGISERYVTCERPDGKIDYVSVKKNLSGFIVSSRQYLNGAVAG